MEQPKFLAESYNCEEFVIFDLNFKQKRNFLVQDLINFKKAWFLQDHVTITSSKPDVNYLKKIEEKYKINLWMIAYSERIFYTWNKYYKFNRDEILSILEQECKFFESVLNEVKPDFLLIRTTDWHRNHLLAELCNAKKIKVLMLNPIRFGRRAAISDDLDKFEDVNNINFSEKNNRTSEKLYEFKNKFNKRKELDKLDIKGSGISFNKKIILTLKFLILLTNTNYKKFYENFGRSPIKVLSKEPFFWFKKLYREYFLNKNSLKRISGNEKFVFFPHQYEPERTLSINAPFYSNQQEVIVQIVRSLPVDYKLYVKEHPDMRLRGWRETSYYKKILELPNVELLHPQVHPEEILSKCSLVITISGTSGLEALFHGKPSIVFSDVSYHNIPSVFRVRNIEELPQIIRSALKKKIDVADLNKYVNLIDENSFEFSLTDIYNKIYQRFYYNKFFFDAEISLKDLKSFLEENRKEFEILVSEHIKKIQQHKDNKLKKGNIEIEG